MKKKSIPGQIFFWFSIVVLCTYVLLPLINMAVASVKPLEEIQVITDSFFPRRWDFGTYTRMWKTVPLLHYIGNTFIIVGFATLFSMGASIFAGYAMQRFRFRAGKAFGNMLILAQMLPGILFLLPLYLLFNFIRLKLGVQLVGTHAGVIITYMTFSLPFSIWMMKSYFGAIPIELEEAAFIDGCGHFRTLFRIILPVSVPGIIAVGIYSFLVGWEEILFASVLTNAATRTLSVGLRNYASAQVVYWNEMMAAALCVTVPVVLIFLFLQKYLVMGLTAGSVKG
jgi:multiple sugar transport system permease protein